MVGGARTELWRRLSFCYCLVHVNVCAVERERERERTRTPAQTHNSNFSFPSFSISFLFSLFSFLLFPPFSPPVLVVANRFPFVELFSHILHHCGSNQFPPPLYLFIYLFTVGLFLLVGPFLWRSGGGPA